MDNFPLAPGHEIAGLVQAVGNEVTKFKAGDKVAVGCFVESCGDCTECGKGLQNYCRQQVQTYGTPWNAERYGHEVSKEHTLKMQMQQWFFIHRVDLMDAVRLHGHGFSRSNDNLSLVDQHVLASSSLFIHQV